MSPTVFRDGPFRYYFFSREEERPHIHVQSGDGEAKFWIEPNVELATSFGLTEKQIRGIEKKVTEHRDEIRDAWRKHFTR